MTPEERFEMIVGKVNVIRREGYRVSAQCPSHADEKASLSVNMGNKCVLVHCYGGCDIDTIMGAIGLRVSDVFFNSKDVHRTAPREQPNAATISKQSTIDALMREVFPEVESYEGWSYNENRELDERLLSYCENYGEMIIAALPKKMDRLEIVWLRLNTLLHAVLWYHDHLMGNHKKADEMMLKCDKTALRQLALVGIIESAIFPKVKHGILLDDYMKVCSRGIWAWERGLCGK